MSSQQKLVALFDDCITSNNMRYRVGQEVYDAMTELLALPLLSLTWKLKPTAIRHTVPKVVLDIGLEPREFSRMI